MSLTSANFDQQFSDLIEDSAQFKSTCLKIAQSIEKKETTLINFIEAAEPYLINRDNEKRLKGVAILATILANLRQDVPVLNLNQMEYLCAFLIKRLKDHHTVVPAILKAIFSLITLKNFPKDVITAILNGIFLHISCQTLQPKERLILYKIFALLVENYQEELAEMGPDFVYGVIFSVENERNPQNLLYLFNWFPFFCKNMQLGHLTEDMFDTLSCYFPVDYQPLNTQPDSISREELADALSPALYAIPEFGGLCLPFALEKLSSDLLVAKFDSLKLLMHGTTEFTSETYSAYATDIISSIKCQIFQSDNSELKKQCCDCLTAVSKKLSKTCELSKYEEVLLYTYEMVVENLGPYDKYFAASNLFLSAFAQGSSKAAEIIVAKITHKFIKDFQIDDGKRKVDILKTQYVYTRVLIQFGVVSEEILNEIQHFFYNAWSNNNDVIQIQGIICLALIVPYINREMKGKLLKMLRTELLNQNSNAEYKRAVFHCFECFAKCYPDEINELIQENCENLANLNGYLEMIGTLVKLEQYTNTIMAIVTNLCTRDLMSSTIALKELRTILTNTQNQPEIENRIITYLIQERFVYKQVLWTLSIIKDIKSSKHKDFLIDLLYVAQNIMGNDCIENQQVLVDELLPRILCNTEDCIIMVLISCVLTRLKPELDFNNDHLSYLVTNCFKEQEDDFLLTTSQELVANLINKCKHDTKLDDHLNFITNFSEIFAQDTFFVENYHFKFVPLITKALIMRGHPQSSAWIQKMIGLLSTSDKMIHGFAIVLSDNIDSLSCISYCTIRLFYKQRFFSEVSTVLKNKPSNPNYLNAFCIMLTNISYKIFALEFTKNLPLIKESIDKCNDIPALTALLKMLQITINQERDMIIGNINDILPGLLKLFNLKNSMAIRVLAIQSVEQFLNGYPIDTLSNQRDFILKALSSSIDDKKRIVRKVAADSRSKWFLFGENN